MLRNRLIILAIIASTASAADGDVQITLQGKPALPGDYKPADVTVNGQEIKALAYANDAATYRAALRSARYQVEDISFPAGLLKAGANTVRFAMTAAGTNGGIMYDTIKLEIE